MPKFSNRTQIEDFVVAVVQDQATVTFSTSGGSFSVPLTPLTQKIYVEDNHPYVIEYDNSSHVLSGVFAPDGSTIYRISDDQVRTVSHSVEHLSRVVKNGVPLELADAIETMMSYTSETFKERFKNLPEDYLNIYYIYEVKVSYLASNPPTPYLFDPTPNELAHALALSMVDSPTYPPLILKAS